MITGEFPNLLKYVFNALGILIIIYNVPIDVYIDNEVNDDCNEYIQDLSENAPADSTAEEAHDETSENKIAEEFLLECNDECGIVTNMNNSTAPSKAIIRH